MSETLWAAVDRLTKPSRVPLERVADPEWLNDLAAPSWGSCNVGAYRAATATWATVPSLWDQATAALTTGSEAGGTGSSPLRERSPLDVDLMEVRGIIRDTVRHELAERDRQPIPADVPAQLRRLASIVLRDDPDNLWWWEYRFQQWGRLLETYLRAAEHTARPTRLRNTPCPLCRVKQIRVETESGDKQLVPPIVVDFRDGYIRAARCEACSASWFRGDELHELARLVTTEEGKISA